MSPHRAARWGAERDGELSRGSRQRHHDLTLVRARVPGHPFGCAPTGSAARSEQAEHVTGRVVHDPDVVLRLPLGLPRTEALGPGYPALEVVAPDVEVELHLLGAPPGRPAGGFVLLLELERQAGPAAGRFDHDPRWAGVVVVAVAPAEQVE